MFLLQKEIDDIWEINSFAYEQYNSGWCKAFVILDEENDDYDKEIDLFKYLSITGNKLDKTDVYIRNYKNNRANIEACKDIVRVFIDEELDGVTSESFMYKYRLLESDWQLSQNNEHIYIIDKIIELSLYYIEKQKSDAKKEVLDYLNYWDLCSIDEYEDASEELKKDINLQDFYNNWGLTEEGSPHLDFTAYPSLRKLLIDGFFDENTVHFFSNVAINQIEKVISEKENVIAVIGMDKNKLALFWFNY